MQVLCQYFVMVALFSSVYCKLETKDIRSVSSGLSFGMCRGYCQQSINITASPLQIFISKEANFEKTLYPSIQKPMSLPSEQWEELIPLLNLKSFEALGNTIGCPDCADGGAEWVQVNWVDGSKRITFENGRVIKGIEELIERLRQIRKEYLAQI